MTTETTTSSYKEKYITTAQLCRRFSCARGTLYRWMDRKVLPFPKPTITANGSQNRWRFSDVLKWEIQVAELNNQETDVA